MGPHGRRNTRRKNLVERNTPMLGRLIEASHGKATKAAVSDGTVASRRIAPDGSAAAYLQQRLPKQIALLEEARCFADREPNCKGCPVRHFCSTWRAKEGKTKPDGTKIIDLFCGAGGMSQGFEEAGYVPALAVDTDLDAILTYRANRPWLDETKAVARDIRELVKDGTFDALAGKVEGIIGGPPCQTFSLVGYRTKKKKDKDGKKLDDGHEKWRDGRIEDDHRTWLPIYMANIIADVQPKFCVMENVAGFLSALNGDVRKKTHKTIVAAGYTVVEIKLRAEKNGAPQYRWRYLLIGLRNDAVRGRRRAEELLKEVKERLEMGTSTLISAAEALAVLKPLGPVPAGGGAEFMVGGGLETWNHYARPHNPRDREIYALLEPGETAGQLEARKPDTIPYELESFKDKYRKLDTSRPSPTIPAHLKRDSNSFVLPVVNRGVTPREAATLQGFPVDYIFTGEQTHQFQQIGNAVPPPVAKNVALLIKEALEHGASKRWNTVLVGERGRRPHKRTMIVREHLVGLRLTDEMPEFTECLQWACKRLQKPKHVIKPMVAREWRRALRIPVAHV